MSIAGVFAFLIGAVGIVALVLAAPRRRWDDAMERLSSRIRAESTSAVGRGVGPGEHHDQLPARHGDATLTVASVPRDGMDRLIDRFVEFLRSAIRTKSLPRRVLVGVGMVLVAIAVLIFSLSSGGGSSDGEDMPVPGSSHAPSVTAA